MSSTDKTYTEEARRYLAGYVAALVLTALSFALVVLHAASKSFLLPMIAVSAIAQAIVHLRFFLHLDWRETPSENLAAAAFALVVLAIMVGGTFWIMFDLNARMM